MEAIPDMPPTCSAAAGDAYLFAGHLRFFYRNPLLVRVEQAGAITGKASFFIQTPSLGLCRIRHGVPGGGVAELYGPAAGYEAASEVGSFIPYHFAPGVKKAERKGCL